MTQDDIIRMAREAGGYLAELPNGDAWLFDGKQQLERFFNAAYAAGAAAERERIYFETSSDFVKSAVAAEREACARVCEEPGWNAANWCAKAIRARGN